MQGLSCSCKRMNRDNFWLVIWFIWLVWFILVETGWRTYCIEGDLASH